jgi:HD superfamily phosphohydrolase YqeK
MRLKLPKRNAAWWIIRSGSAMISDKSRRAAFEKLLDCYKSGFCISPAASAHHHNFAGGLAIHTAEVMEHALELRQRFSSSLSDIPAGSVYIAAVLHDLPKIKQYMPNPMSHSVRKFEFVYDKSWDFEPDIWTISEAARFGLQLTYDEMMGIVQAHGGWSKMRDPVSRLGALIHIADMISSQITWKEGK